jgi:Putative auto-transporter adhesin, head GIN domain
MTTLLQRCCLAWLLSCAAAAAWAQAPQARTYSLGEFDGIEISGSAAIRFVQGEVDQVSVEGDDGSNRSIDMEVSRGTLSIRSSGAWKFWTTRQQVLVVTARELKRVTISGAGSFHAPQGVRADRLAVAISGSGSVRFDQLDAQSLRFAISGAGDGVLAGRTRELSVAISGKGKFDGEQLASETARVAVSGVGDALVWATRELSVSVAGVGNVDYWGSPQVKRSVSGSSDIRARGDKSAPR